jgi:undecaprenyl-diphosphatase
MDIIELLKAVVIGIIEGVTEWLPISSTGHMILADEFVVLNVSEQFRNMFLVVIQLGAIMAVIVLYLERLNPFSSRKDAKKRSQAMAVWLKVIVGCIPAAILGGLFSQWFEDNFFNAVTVALALVIYGVAFIAVERHKANQSARLPYRLNRQASYGTRSLSRSTQMRYSNRSSDDAVNDVDALGFGKAFAIGLFQCLAIIPGTSRSGATILGGRILGVSREASAEFSFFLAIPVMFGWSLLKVLRVFVFGGMAMTATEWGVLILGTLVAFLVSIAAIRFLIEFIKRNSFEAFGWYRIVLGVVVLLFFLLTGQL